MISNLITIVYDQSEQLCSKFNDFKYMNMTFKPTF